mmetsp:Transcript_309/g.864  ORF Transcript_309/g.864 Transcript_309/m.864 type:complete len:331 (-) Transcript_309:55-1047(-)
MYGFAHSGPAGGDQHLQSGGGAVSYGAMPPAYGGAPLMAEKANAEPPRHRSRINVTAVLICLVAPCILFCTVSAALSFPLRRESPALAGIAVVVAALIMVASVYLAISTTYKRWEGKTMREPFWYIFFGATMALSFTGAYGLGETNWWNNVLPYMDLQTLDTRYNVDPTTTLGQQLMDVGRVVFAEGSHVDVTRSIGFKNVDQYCVAPIVHNTPGVAPESYDFWAIGLNCCSGGSPDFHCGDYANPGARGGLRIARADQREFYRLAVQQAEAAYNMRSQHPLFFYWVADPGAELESYKADARKSFFLGNLSFFAMQLLLVLVGVVVYAKF